ncbi:hypothetical protein HMPREF9144_2155 [Prevotella pallens ATCC 700821]|uniref:Uncharacterized protein n=1 Tax=Prevotella pallens ATCC 700821 TaxID=997353 RepID=F9DKG3_9BACT|nr:hypothetical protein HMPREF9144_2155 [Prevotella pallens ATCC 700821]
MVCINYIIPAKTKTPFLQNKNYLFARQKLPFCNAKTILLKFNHLLM